MYINFRYPPGPVEHSEGENGIVKNLDEAGKLAGFTVREAKRFMKAPEGEKRGAIVRRGVNACCLF